MMPRRLLFVSPACALLFSFLSTPPTRSQNSQPDQNKVRTVVLKAPLGQVKVYLPGDIAAGDTMSGTVTTEPAGKTETEKQNNTRKLNGLVIHEVNKASDSAEEQRWPVSGGVIQKLKIGPALIGNLQLILLDEKGKRIDIATIPITPTPNPSAPPNFLIPQIGQTGRLLPITGPFDGNSANTNINIGGTNAKVIAESPRSAFVEIPKTVVGPSNIKVTDNGSSATGNFRALKIDLTAPKTSLIKGESTELHVEVQGLEGITQPVPIQIQNQTPQNINLTGGNTQNIVINPSQVTPGGTFNWSTPITGTGTGGFNVTGTIPSSASPTSAPSPLPVTSKPTATPTPNLPPPTKPEVYPAPKLDPPVTFTKNDTDCCKRFLNQNGELAFWDEKGNGFQMFRNKLTMKIDGQEYQWEFTQDGEPFYIEWVFCHLADHSIISQLTSVMTRQVKGANTDESGRTTSISMAGPYRDEKTTRPFYGFQFGAQKIGTSNKEYAISFSMDEETCKWSFQLFAEDETISYSTGPPGSPVQIYRYLMGNNNLRGPNSSTQGVWWSNLYRVAGEIVSWQAWLAEHPDAEQSQALSNAFDVWRLLVKNAIDNRYGSASAADKQLFDQMRALLSPTSLSPGQMNQVFWKFNDLWMRFRNDAPPK